MNRLMAIILTYNEQRHITACIESVRFADSVLVFDSFSTDETVILAKNAGAQVIQHQFDNYANQRNAALAAAQGQAEWVLFVDADERISPELAAEVRAAMDKPAYAGWRMPRHNYIFGRLTRGAGWYPDYQMRLLRAGKARYDPMRKVHEVVLLEGPEGTLTEPIIHYNYDHAAQFATKQRKYTAYEAQIMFNEGIRPRPHNFILQPLRHFRWRYITLKGYTDGLHGLRLSAWMAWYEWVKYWRLRGLWRAQGQGEPPQV
ncbi:MAG: glycosyltransferase family 2 protein [Anaerolineae bacterium]